MAKEPIKVVIEVSGGNVQAVYAGNVVQPMIEVVIVDHDNVSISECTKHQPLVNFKPQDHLDYDGGFPDSWGLTRNQLIKSFGG